MNLEKLIVSDAEETRTELVVVKATLAFEMVDGKCTEESLQPLYDLIAPKEEVTDERLATDPIEEDLDTY